MTLLKDMINLVEVTQPVNPELPLEDQLEILEGRLAAAKRGLGFANKLKNPVQKKKHMALVLTNLNKIRASLGKVIEIASQFERAERDYFTDPRDDGHEMTGADDRRYAMGEGKTFKHPVDDKKRAEKARAKQYKEKKSAQIDEVSSALASSYLKGVHDKEIGKRTNADPYHPSNVERRRKMRELPPNRKAGITRAYDRIIKDGQK
jgi:hypothetical protein